MNIAWLDRVIEKCNQLEGDAVSWRDVWRKKGLLKT